MRRHGGRPSRSSVSRRGAGAAFRARRASPTLRIRHHGHNHIGRRDARGALPARRVDTSGNPGGGPRGSVHPPGRRLLGPNGAIDTGRSGCSRITRWRIARACGGGSRPEIALPDGGSEGLPRGSPIRTRDTFDETRRVSRPASPREISDPRRRPGTAATHSRRTPPGSPLPRSPHLGSAQRGPLRRHRGASSNLFPPIPSDSNSNRDGRIFNLAIVFTIDSVYVPIMPTTIHPTSDEYEWDEAKRLATLAERGIDFIDIVRFDWDQQVTKRIDSSRHGEIRILTLSKIDEKLHACVWTPRNHRCRVISLRKASKKERKLHGAQVLLR